MERFVFPPPRHYAIIAITFDCGCLKQGSTCLYLILNLINKEWVFCHITIGLFEALNMFKDVK
jgi:hypothetical protein